MTEPLDDPARSVVDDSGDDALPRDAEPPRRPTALETFERFQPVIAVSVMAATFVSMPQALAVALVGLVWLVTTRFSRNHRFLGLTLTEALAWAATLVIIFLGLALAAYFLLPPA
jgi:hypothetical protein